MVLGCSVCDISFRRHVEDGCSRFDYPDNSPPRHDIRGQGVDRLMLPVLCFADVIGVSYYRRQAEWKYIFRLLPMAIASFFLALWVDHLIPATEFKHLMFRIFTTIATVISILVMLIT